MTPELVAVLNAIAKLTGWLAVLAAIGAALRVSYQFGKAEEKFAAALERVGFKFDEFVKATTRHQEDVTALLRVHEARHDATEEKVNRMITEREVEERLRRRSTDVDIDRPPRGGT